MPDKTSSLVFLNYMTTAFDNIQDAILLIGVEPRNRYRLLLANKVFAEMSGYPTDSVGKLVAEITSPESFTHLRRKYQLVIKTKQPHGFTAWSDVPAGRRAFESRLIPVLNTVGECSQIIVIARDVTEREQLREEIRTLRATLQSKQPG